MTPTYSIPHTRTSKCLTVSQIRICNSKPILVDRHSRAFRLLKLWIRDHLPVWILNRYGKGMILLNRPASKMHCTSAKNQNATRLWALTSGGQESVVLQAMIVSIGTDTDIVEWWCRREGLIGGFWRRRAVWSRRWNHLFRISGITGMRYYETFEKTNKEKREQGVDLVRE